MLTWLVRMQCYSVDCALAFVSLMVVTQSSHHLAAGFSPTCFLRPLWGLDCVRSYLSIKGTLGRILPIPFCCFSIKYMECFLKVKKLQRGTWREFPGYRKWCLLYLGTGCSDCSTVETHQAVSLEFAYSLCMFCCSKMPFKGSRKVTADTVWRELSFEIWRTGNNT